MNVASAAVIVLGASQNAVVERPAGVSHEWSGLSVVTLPLLRLTADARDRVQFNSTSANPASTEIELARDDAADAISPAAHEFLAKDPGLDAQVTRMLTRLTEFFPGDQLKVDVYVDPEVPDARTRIGVTVETKRDSSDVIERLNAFNDWLLDSDWQSAPELWIRHV